MMAYPQPRSVQAPVISSPGRPSEEGTSRCLG